jgi:hypothetical protein
MQKNMQKICKKYEILRKLQKEQRSKRTKKQKNKDK